LLILGDLVDKEMKATEFHCDRVEESKQATITFLFLFFYIRDWRKAMNQQNDRPGTPATSQLPTHMRGKGIRTG
jgi:hypothetical protein